MKFNWQKIKWTWTFEKLKIIHPPQMKSETKFNWLFVTPPPLTMQHCLSDTCTFQIGAESVGNRLHNHPHEVKIQSNNIRPLRIFFNLLPTYPFPVHIIQLMFSIVMIIIIIIIIALNISIRGPLKVSGKCLGDIAKFGDNPKWPVLLI